jgi:hypothetical protein
MLSVRSGKETRYDADTGRELTEQQIRAELKNNYGLSQNWRSRFGSTVAIISIISFTIVVAVWAAKSYEMQNWPDVAVVILTTGVLLVGYTQWRAGRYEISLDKYYDRLDLSNSYLEKANGGLSSTTMYAFVELDTLEYVVEKYKLAYILPHHAYRAVKAFEVHCKDQKGLRNEALEIVKGAGYQETTVEIVTKIIKNIKGGEKHPKQQEEQ